MEVRPSLTLSDEALLIAPTGRVIGWPSPLRWSLSITTGKVIIESDTTHEHVLGLARGTGARVGKSKERRRRHRQEGSLLGSISL
jgi:hypothetical protein